MAKRADELHILAEEQVKELHENENVPKHDILEEV